MSDDQTSLNLELEKIESLGIPTIHIQYSKEEDNADKIFDLLKDEKKVNQEMRLKLYDAQQKIQELQTEYSIKLEKIIKENHQKINLFTQKIENLSSTISNLHKLLQPKPLTNIDKKRQLQQFIDEEEDE